MLEAGVIEKMVMLEGGGRGRVYNKCLRLGVYGEKRVMVEAGR